MTLSFLHLRAYPTGFGVQFAKIFDDLKNEDARNRMSVEAGHV